MTAQQNHSVTTQYPVVTLARSARWASASSSCCWSSWSACACPTFLTLDNFRDILLNISILAIVALAQTMVIITRGIDLSVGSMIGLVAMMVSFVIKENPEMSVVLAVLLGMALGSVLGSFNGLIIT